VLEFIISRNDYSKVMVDYYFLLFNGSYCSSRFMFFKIQKVPVYVLFLLTSRN